MTKPDIRKLLIVLARWAADAKDYLTYQAKHGKAPPRAVALKAEVLQGLGFIVSPSPNPLSDLLTKWRITRKGSVPNPVLGDLGDPFYQLYCVAQSKFRILNHAPRMNVHGIDCRCRETGGTPWASTRFVIVATYTIHVFWWDPPLRIGRVDVIRVPYHLNAGPTEGAIYVST